MKHLVHGSMAILLTALSIGSAEANPIHLEAERGIITGAKVSKAIPGYSGAGYVEATQSPTIKLAFNVPAGKAGIYSVSIRYSSPFDRKEYLMRVNGTLYSGVFAKTGNGFATQAGGKVDLHSGPNTLIIQNGWGFYDIDYVDLIPAKIEAALKTPPAALSDPQASSPARRLMRYLVGVYGKKTLSGQYNAGECQYIQTVTHKVPAILGGDFRDYSPSLMAFGTKPKGYTEQMVRRGKSGQIITMLWHWNAPSGLVNKMSTDAQGRPVDLMWYKGFLTAATTFDLQRALSNPKSKEYGLLLRDIDAIAVQLKKFDRAGIPVLWRPLHEADGQWFWWGAKGPKPFIALWKLMYTRLTKQNGIHNLIWVYTGSKPDWYPGDAYVDIVGIDAYPADQGDPLSSQWINLKKRYNGRKLLALTEFGGVPDIPKMRRYGVEWAYFTSWTGTLGPHKVSAPTLSRIYQNSAVVTQDQLK